MSRSGLSVDTSGLTTSATDGQRPIVHSGRLAFADPYAIDILDPRWSVPTDGTTDATTAVTAAAAAAGAGGRLHLAGLPFVVNNWRPPDQITVQGAGPATVLKAASGAPRAVNLEARKHVLLSDLQIDGVNATAEALRIVADTSGGTTGSQRNELHHVRLSGSTGNVGVAGIAVRDNGIASNQADKTTYINVVVNNFDIGYLMECPNGQNHIWYGGDFSTCTKGVSAKAGTATFIGTQWQTCTTSISFDGPNVQSMALTDVYMEGATTDIDGSTYWPTRGLIATQVRFASAVNIGKTGAQFKATLCEFDQPINATGTDVTMWDEGCIYSGSGSWNPTGTNCRRIRVQNTSPGFTLSGTGNQITSVEALSGHTSELRLGGNGTQTAFRFTTDSANTGRTTLTLNNGSADVTHLRVYPNHNGGTGPAAAIGSNDNAAVLTLANAGPTNGKVLVARAAASQAGNIFEAQDSGQNPLVTVSENGYLTLRKNSIVADAELASGELALWFDSTNGAAKLMVKAKSANGTVVTGSLALA